MKNVLTHLSHQIQMYTVSQKKCLPIIILLCSLVKNEPIYIIFGTENPEDIWCQFLYSCPPYLKCHHTTLWNAELFTWLKLWFPTKILPLWKKQPAVMFSRNLNYRQPVSKDLLKVIIVWVETPFLSLILIHHHVLLAFISCLSGELMWLTCMLCYFNVFGTHTTSFCELVGEQQ